MTGAHAIILCQPDERKGCSACCGLFNMRDLNRRHLEDFLAANGPITGHEQAREVAEHQLRDATSYTCPYQGFISPGKPGCLLHPGLNESDRRDRSFYGKKICLGFLCPAHAVLNDDEKADLIALVDDWYLYTVSIIDPEGFRWILGCVKTEAGPGGNPARMKKTLAACLERRAAGLAAAGGAVFHYSLSEYNLAKEKFSLVAGTPVAEQERRDIERICRRPC